MYLFKLFHNGEEVVMSKENVRVTCKDLDEHIVHHNNSVYKIGVPVLNGLKSVYIITDASKSDFEVFTMLKNFAVEHIKMKVSGAKAALEEWERYNVEQ